MRPVAAPACPAPAAKLPVLKLPPPAIPVDVTPAPQTGDKVMAMSLRWLDDILAHRKTVVVRNKPWRPGWIWLASGGKVYGRAKIKSVTHMTEQEFRNARGLHLWPACQPLPYDKDNLYGLALQTVESLEKAYPGLFSNNVFRHRDAVPKKAQKKRRPKAEPGPEDCGPQTAESIKEAREKNVETDQQTVPKQQAGIAKKKRAGKSRKKMLLR